MAITKTVSNHFKYKCLVGDVDASSDTFKIILTNGLTFDKDSHATLADVTASQLSTGNGYTQNDETLVIDGSVTEDDTNDRGSVTFSDVTFTASGGSIGPFDAAIIYDDTTADDTVVGAIELGTTVTLSSGQSYQFTAPSIRLA